MLRVKTCLQHSEIHGLGLFAAEFIPKDTLVWDFDPGFDPFFPIDCVRQKAAEDPIFAAYASRYGYVEKSNPGCIAFNVDNSRFVNDSQEPTLYVDEVGIRSFAIRDLQIGEELTNRYDDFLIDSDVSLRITWRS
jgi:SET domain-containing protein